MHQNEYVYVEFGEIYAEIMATIPPIGVTLTSESEDVIYGN